MAMAYIVTIVLTLLAFNSVSSSITAHAGCRFAEKQVLYEKLGSVPQSSKDRVITEIIRFADVADMGTK